MLFIRKSFFVVLALASVIVPLALHAASPFSDTPTYSIGTDGNIFATVLSGTTLYVGGNFTSFFTPLGNGFAIAQADASVAFDAGFPQVNGVVRASVPDGSGGWYIGGDFSMVGTTEQSYLAHILSNGDLDATFDVLVSGPVYALLLNGTTLYIGGDFGGIQGENRVGVGAVDVETEVLLDLNPALDTAPVNALALEGTTLYIGGGFTCVGYTESCDSGSVRNRIAAIDTETSLPTSFDPNVDDVVTDLLLDGTTLYASGYFIDVNAGTARNRIAAFNTSDGVATVFDPNLDSFASTIALVDGTIYAGGDFTDVNSGTVRYHLAAFATSTGEATSFDPAPDSSVLSLMSDGTTLYAGGSFTCFGFDGATCLGDSRQGYALIDTSDGSVLPPNATLSHSATVRTIALDGTNAYIGGSIDGRSLGARNHLAALNLTTGEFTSFDPNLDDAVHALALDGTTLYAGGDFADVNSGTTRNHLAAFNTADGVATDFDPAPDSSVYALALDGTTLYAGGDFTGFFGVNAGTVRNYLAAFNTTDGVATDFDPDLDNGVRALALDGATLYASGLFGDVNSGTTRNFLAAFNTSDSLATDLNPVFDNVPVTLTLDGTTLYAGGYFSDINSGTTRNYLAAFNTSDGVATDFNPTPDGNVYTTGLADGILYAAGDFLNAGGGSRYRLAGFDTTTGLLDPFDPATSISNTGYSVAVNSSYLAFGTDNRLFVFDSGVPAGDDDDDDTPPPGDDDDDDVPSNTGGNGGHHKPLLGGSGAGSSVGGNLNLEALIATLRELLQELINQGGTLPLGAEKFLVPTSGGSSFFFTHDLKLGDAELDVRKLQEFLIAQNKGLKAQALDVHGATGFFGPLTQAALAEYQASLGIVPAVGYFGPLTRTQINGVLGH